MYCCTAVHLYEDVAANGQLFRWDYALVDVF
jgi:hypothetical protein